MWQADEVCDASNRRSHGQLTRDGDDPSTARLKTGTRRFRRLVERWARRVFRPTGQGPPGFEHEDEDKDEETYSNPGGFRFTKSDAVW